MMPDGLPEGFRAIGKTSQGSSGGAFGLACDEGHQVWLHVEGEEAAGFDGDATLSGKLCPLSAENARRLGEFLPWLRPQRIPTDQASFGFGDRLGLAAPGHIRSLKGHSVFPVLAQQSVRENARTGRTFSDVLKDAVFAALREGYQGGFGADADHLKEVDDAIEAAQLGYTFFTCDPGDLLEDISSLESGELERRFAAIPEGQSLTKRYADQSFGLRDPVVYHFTEDQFLRTAVKFEVAIDRAARMYEAIHAIQGDAFDYEVSVDETSVPTSPLEHLYVAMELERRGVKLASLAPRFVGAIEKGVDWRGDREAFDRQLHEHALIARSAGTYRLSLHSGSDKYSIYPALVAETKGRCHIKTAGTSYLVALQVVAAHDKPLFREILRQSLAAFAADKATYHISADPARIPAADQLKDDDLVGLVEQHDSRQLLHVAFGSIVHGPLGDDLRAVLVENEDAHFEAVAKHMQRHLDAMQTMEVESDG